MQPIYVDASPPATLLVTAGQGATMLINNDPLATLWLGDSNAILPADPGTTTGVVPILAGQSLVVDGNRDVYGIADATASNQIEVLVIEGGLSFFQPISSLVVQGIGSRILIYNGQAGAGNLVGSWSSSDGVDQYGNPYGIGINANQGTLTGVTLDQAAMISSTIQSTLISASQIQSSTFSGGQISESIITFNSSAGGLFMYTTTTTVTTINATGSYTGPPASVPSFRVQLWGGDGGGGGGNSGAGGEAGGGAEYAEEPAYPNYNPGGLYNVQIGLAGKGGRSNSAGTSGTATRFDGSGVIANPGLAGPGGFIGGQGGSGSTASIHYNGGNGGSNNVNGYAASAGGGGRAGSTGPGGNGQAPSGNSSPGFGGSAGSGTGGIVGSNGVVAGTNGNQGNAGGSGAGQAGSGTTYQTKYYDPTSTASYYGAGVGGGLRGTNGSMFQGDPNVPVTTFPGDQESFANYDYSQIRSDHSGWTIDQTTFDINNQHSWYGSGCYCVLGYADQSTGNHPNVTQFWVNQGQGSGQVDISVFNSVIASSFVAFMLGPSSSTSGGSLDLWNYGYFQGNKGAGGPRVTIHSHKGTTGSYIAGNGNTGQAIISYQTSSGFVGAASPVAGTDANGNTYGAGFTGPIQGLQPGSSPQVLETPHTVSYLNSWTKAGTSLDLQYMLMPDGRVHLSGRLLVPGSPSNPSEICVIGTSAYWPFRQTGFTVVEHGGSPYAATPHFCVIGTNGTLNVYGVLSGGNTLEICTDYSTVM